MAPADDRRRHDRFSAEDVRGSFSYTVQAHVLNISIGGLAVRIQTQLAIGRRYRFRLGAERDAVELEGSVRWCRLCGTERLDSGDIVPMYEAGISFDDVLTDRAEDLLQFMERNIIVDLKTRVSGRFKVESGAALELESNAEFEVKQLSLSGLMVESAAAIEAGTSLELEIAIGDEPFVSRARVIYRSEIEPESEATAPLCRLGIELVETESEQRARLERFIRTELNREQAEG